MQGLIVRCRPKGRHIRRMRQSIWLAVILMLCSASTRADWRELKPIFGGQVKRIVTDAAGTLYLSTGGSPVKSIDNGETWQPILGNLPTSSISAMAADPTVPGVVYAGTEEGLYRTEDGGGIWTKLQLNIPGIEIREVVVAPTNRDYIFVATWGSYVWRSKDLGATWQRCSLGLSGGWGGPSYIPAIAVDPANADRVYTSTWRGNLFRSDDAADHWYQIDGSGTWANGQIYISRSSPNVLYTTHDETWFQKGTVLKSTDSGATWFNIGRPSGYMSDAGMIAINPTDPNILYVTTGRGLYRSTTGGGSWSLVFQPPGYLGETSAVAIRPDDPSNVYAGSPYSGFFRSPDAGMNWSQHNDGIAAVSITSIEICRDAPSVIYVGAQGVGYLKSADGGSTWSAIGSFANHWMGGLAVHPQNPDVVVAATSDGSRGWMWKTIDGGNNFYPRAIGYAPSWIRFNPLLPDYIHASVSDWQGGLLRSTDAGSSWSVPYWYYTYPGTYEFHPDNRNIVFSPGSQYTGAAVGTLYLMWSNDSGQTWCPNCSYLGLSGLPDIALDKNDPSTIYMAGRLQNEGTQGIYKLSVSYDASSGAVRNVSRVSGTFNNGLTTTAVRRILYDKATSTLYLTTANGVFRSKDGALTWTDISLGLPYTNTGVMAITPDGKRLLVGTSGGVWEYTEDQSPVANAGPDQDVSANSDCQGVVTLDGSGSSDPDGDSLSYAWEGPFGFATGPTPQVTLPRGSHTIVLTVDDGRGGTAVDEVQVTVVDRTPPTLFDFPDELTLPSDASCRADVPDLMHMIMATDNCTPADELKRSQDPPPGTSLGMGMTLANVLVRDDAGNSASAPIQVQVTNDPPTAAAGGPYKVMEGSAVNLTATASDPEDGQLTFSWDLDNDGIFETSGRSVLFPAKDGPANQMIAVQVGDSCGLSASAQAVVTIENGLPAVDPISAPVAPLLIGLAVGANASFADPGRLDTHSAVWDWGDGITSPGSVDETSHSVTGSHSYNAAGVYRLTLTVSDDDGGSGRSFFEYIVIYDPSAGFVTGGGWINSPPGAYPANPILSGKATFGFVSKYPKGSSVPGGNTQFKFHTAEMNFISTSYQWLVIAGARAQYKGDGTINGAGSFGFLLTAVDGQSTGGGGQDRFRIKIWDKGTGQIVYDNQIGADDNSDVSTVLLGGSIVIHR